jgi:hypothetical protein
MRSLTTLTAVAVLSTFIIAAPANAQAARRNTAVIVSPEVFAAQNEQQPQPVAVRTQPRIVTVPQPGIKDCRDFYAARGGWVSPTCTAEELTVYLSANGFSMAPAARTTTYSTVSPEEQARRDRLMFDEQMRERQIAFDASVQDTQADRDAQRQNHCEGQALGREVLGGVANALTGALESRLTRGGYYRGGYYGSRGSSCGRY